LDKELLKPGEVAETLRVGRSLVYEMFSTGELPSIRVGRCNRVPRASLEKWLADREQGKGWNDRGDGGVPAAPTG
jgi:prophage regulatory protein